MKKQGVDVVVVNYRTPVDLQGFLDSFDEWVDDMPPTHLYIVNVAPEDADTRVAETYLHTRTNVTYIAEPTNVGYARAVNGAASRGTGETIAIFNADTRLTAGALEDCHYALTYHDDWGVLGPRQVDDHGRMTHAGIFGTLDAPRHRGWKHSDNDAYKDVREAVTVSGSAYFIKRKVWDQLAACDIYKAAAPLAEGAFLPTPHYYEETFCSYHAQAHGHKVIYYGPVCIVHRWHQASEQGGPADRVMGMSRELFRDACDAHSIAHD